MFYHVLYLIINNIYLNILIDHLNNLYIVICLVYASSSKYPRGVLSNEVVELGNYDQCMSVSSSERYDIHGAYAIANIGFRHTKSDFKPLDFLSAHRERLKVTIIMDKKCFNKHV